MSRAARLILDAKQAITEEQLQRFLELQRQGQLEETVTQLGATLACVADLLDEGAEALLALDPQANQRPGTVSQEIKVPIPVGARCLENGGENRETQSGSCEP